MITFKQSSAEGEVAMDIFNEATWPSLCVNFLSFLRGCGYCLSSAEFYDYMLENIEQNEKAEG